MNVELSEKQRRDLLALLINGGEVVMGDIKPPRDRNVLLQAGLIELVAHPTRRTKKVIATEGAWEWAIEHFDTPFTNPSLKPTGLWNGLTRRLKSYLAERGENLATLCSETGAYESVNARAEPGARLRAAYLRLTRGELKRRVRLAELRREAGVEQAEADRALRELLELQQVAVFPEDKQYALRPEDHDAALQESGVAMHIIYWES